MSAIDLLIETAEAEVGYLEKASNSQLDDKTANAGSNNYTKYARDLDNEGAYNGKKNGYAWCDVFVDWCFYATFGLDALENMLYQPLGGAGAGTTYSAKYYKNNSAFYDSPEVGDQIFFSKNGGTTMYHTGIVYKVTSSKVYTIEGNTSSSTEVVANGGGVYEKSYSLSNSKIAGYGRPNWSWASSYDVDYTEVNYQATVNVSSNLNVRSGPSTSYSIVTKLSAGTIVTVSKEYNNFGYLEAYSGWASLDYLEKVEDVSYIPDVSHWHPVSDWSAVKQNCSFIISKATQGTSTIDSTLDSFISGAESYGVPYWLYSYLNAGSELAQAKFLVSTCKSKVGDYFMGYILDVEAGNDASDVQEALEYLESLGGKCMIYTGYSNYSTYKSVINARGDNTAWWEARYGKNDGTYNSSYPCHNADLHQYTSAGTCSGITGNCDLNRITGNGDKDESWFTTTIETEEEDTTTESVTIVEEDDDMTVETFQSLMKEYRATLQDNDASSYSEDARTWAVDNGIIQGSSTEEFNGMWEDFLTREQMVTVLYRFAKLVGIA